MTRLIIVLTAMLCGLGWSCHGQAQPIDRRNLLIDNELDIDVLPDTARHTVFALREGRILLNQLII